MYYDGPAPHFTSVAPKTPAFAFGICFVAAIVRIMRIMQIMMQRDRFFCISIHTFPTPFIR